MRDRVAENSEANWWIDVSGDFTPALEIGECVSVCSLLLVHLGSLRSFRAQSRNPVASRSVTSRDPSPPLRFAQDDTRIRRMCNCQSCGAMPCFVVLQFQP